MGGAEYAILPTVMKAQPAHFALLAALLAGFAAHAATVHVTFDDALTNRTDEAKWEYRDGFVYVEKGDGFAFKKKLGNGEDQVISQVFDFAITSVVLRAKKASTSTTRNLKYRAMSGNADQSAKELVVGIVPEAQVAFTSRWEWAQSDRVHSFALLTTGGDGNVYLYSADISGCYICPQPQNVEAGNVQGTRFTLSWENGEGVVSNRVDVLEVRSVPERGKEIERIDFSKLSNDKNTQERTTVITNAYPDFSGSLLYLPTNSTGIIQISRTSGTPGHLLYNIPGTMTNTTLFLSSRKPNGAPSNYELNISILNGVKTNALAEVSLSESFVTNSIYIGTTIEGDSILFEPTLLTSGDHRIQIDEMTFVRDYAEAYVATNALPPMATDQNRLRIRRLAPKTLYIATVTAFDDEGNSSEPSAPVEVETRSCDPDTVLLLR